MYSHYRTVAVVQNEYVELASSHTIEWFSINDRDISHINAWSYYMRANTAALYLHLDKNRWLRSARHFLFLLTFAFSFLTCSMQRIIREYKKDERRRRKQFAMSNNGWFLPSVSSSDRQAGELGRETSSTSTSFVFLPKTLTECRVGFVLSFHFCVLVKSEHEIFYLSLWFSSLSPPVVVSMV